MSAGPSYGLKMRATTKLTPVQAAVLAACIEHRRNSYKSIQAQYVWWRAKHPFRGGQSACASHLRSLSQKGLLHSVPSGYQLTLELEDQAEQSP